MKIRLLAQIPRSSILFLTLQAVLINGACRSRQTVAPPTGPNRANPNAKRSLGSFRTIYGTTTLMAPIESPSEHSEYSSGGSSGTVYNYVFLNTADGSVHPLLPTNDCLITEMLSFPERKDAGEKGQPVQWLVFFLVKNDTDGDGKLTRDDDKTIAVSDAAGAGYAELISDVQHVFGQTLRDPNTLFLIYKSRSKKYVATVDLPGRKLASITELALEFSDMQ